MLNSCIFTFCNTLSWFIPLISWNSIKATNFFSSLPETKPGPGWFPFFCNCSIVTVIIFQVPGWEKFCNKKVKIPFISLTFYRSLWKCTSLIFPLRWRSKISLLILYNPWHFQHLGTPYAASLSCSDIFLVSSLHFSVCLLVMIQNRKLWKRSTYLFPSLLKVQLSTPTGNSRLLCEWMLQSYSGKRSHGALAWNICKVTWPK